LSTQKLWLTVKETAPLVGRSEKAIYEQIRTGGFPFIVRRSRGDSGAIYISARDVGLIPEQGAANNEAQEGNQSVTTAIPARAFGD
jgi:hypothetical protein